MKTAQRRRFSFLIIAHAEQSVWGYVEERAQPQKVFKSGQRFPCFVRLVGLCGYSQSVGDLPLRFSLRSPQFAQYFADIGESGQIVISHT